ncbi:MAG: hypothetical protein ACYDDV_04405 [Methanoregula sp.]
MTDKNEKIFAKNFPAPPCLGEALRRGSIAKYFHGTSDEHERIPDYFMISKIS